MRYFLSNAATRRRNLRVSAVLFVGLIFVACLLQFNLIDLARSPSASMQIPASEIQIVIEKANNGDIASTKLLINHYLFSESDEATGLKWARLAAKYGDADSRKFVVDVLSRSHLDADQEEAKQLASQWNIPAR